MSYILIHARALDLPTGYIFLIQADESTSLSGSREDLHPRVLRSGCWRDHQAAPPAGPHKTADAWRSVRLGV